ncbi:protein TESPA1 [Vombatus ursinus]|uniref:ITPR-interacting domain-containing protein n=1 Tax=Vombatus ursinus TaxID=29139 RepID=A0A4X2KLA8_VOMUR|nr:protein TESPA1 [Vombatus ursinus]XP_027713870.1 protein TESPA1 [Vombatus ursinus]XP_027713871.1 protein TESPA1 [Vombatus ursinus]XP_027713872.1 protein TESPA1 [Vombatus ursinus]XP_027713873.1 protein TESPA1 [Vombatus ursinus]XP_027713874.1 protein TESPA1 [Vombatus ursinus]
MEVSVLSPTSWEKRRAWLQKTHNWQTQILEEEAAAALQDVPDPEPPNLDDVFLEESPTNKIEDWLQDCGSSEEGFPEDPGLSIHGGCPSHEASFDDDLTLGAEAILLASNGKLLSRSFLETTRPGHLLNLGCSMASSNMTSGTNKTSSSISEILDKVQEDAEDVLFSLGFAQDNHRATARIPARFFTTPSQAKGIDFQVFLKAQVRRIEMEDPCLMLASRFKQVQTLATTADAFFCLYSYVSKTPVQKFMPSQLFWPSAADAPLIRVLPPEPEARSPVERLRRAVSKMCLYTAPRDEPSAPCASAKRNSLDQVVWEVMDRVREDRLALQVGSGRKTTPELYSRAEAKWGIPTPLQTEKLITKASYCKDIRKTEPVDNGDLEEERDTKWGNTYFANQPPAVSTLHIWKTSTPQTFHCTDTEMAKPQTRGDLEWRTEAKEQITWDRERELWVQKDKEETYLSKEQDSNSSLDPCRSQRNPGSIRGQARRRLFQRNYQGIKGRRASPLEQATTEEELRKSSVGSAWLHSIPQRFTEQQQDSLDLEEVLSNSDEEGNNWTSEPECPCSLSLGTSGWKPRSFLLHTSSTHSDSSGFIEDQTLPPPDLSSEKVFQRI